MNIVDIRSTAAELPDAWSSLLLGQAGRAGVKVLRMDALWKRNPMTRRKHCWSWTGHFSW